MNGKHEYFLDCQMLLFLDGGLMLKSAPQRRSFI